MKLLKILATLALTLSVTQAATAQKVSCGKPNNYQEGLRTAHLLASELAQAMLLGALNGETKCQKEQSQLKHVILSDHLEDDINGAIPYPRTIKRDQLLKIDIQESFGRGTKGRALTEDEKNHARNLRFQENAYPMWVTMHIKNQKPFQFEVYLHLTEGYSSEYRCGYTSTWLNRFINYRQCIE